MQTAADAVLPAAAPVFRMSRTNYAFFYTYWDDWAGTATHGKPPCSLLVLTAHAVWQLLVLSTAYALIMRPATTLAAYTTCYLLVPIGAAAALSEQLRLPQITRALFGRVMDQYRSDNYITYADAGTAGAFAAGAGAATAATPAAGNIAATAPEGIEDRDVVKAVSDSVSVRGKDQDLKEPVHIFACHPAGLLSRAAFCTFAARGWRSPVSALQNVRLAVGNALFSVPIPFLREFLLACGCTPAGRDSMRAALRSGCSVAVTPGGWREGRYHSTYKLLLKRRKGFIQLAQKTGAVLVPVLCLGEQDVAVLPEGCAQVPFLLWGYRFLQWFRPHPVRVVFGQVGCSLTRFQWAYCCAGLVHACAQTASCRVRGVVLCQHSRHEAEACGRACAWYDNNHAVAHALSLVFCRLSHPSTARALRSCTAATCMLCLSWAANTMCSWSWQSDCDFHAKPLVWSAHSLGRADFLAPQSRTDVAAVSCISTLGTLRPPGVQS